MFTRFFRFVIIASISASICVNAFAACTYTCKCASWRRDDIGSHCFKVDPQNSLRICNKNENVGGSGSPQSPTLVEADCYQGGACSSDCTGKVNMIAWGSENSSLFITRCDLQGFSTSCHGY